MITLNNIQPLPLKEGGISPNSQTWATKLQFEPTKRYLVTAPSGKGKSTLVHLIYGLRKDYDGTLTLHGNNAQDNDLEAWANLRQTKLSIVFQDLRLFLNLTGLENIQLKANLTNTTSLDEILRMAKHLGVSDYLNRPCATLSYGQRQRIAIIRALCQPFEWLMLDEPFSHLDTENIRLATELIEEKLAAQNAGLIIVTLGDTYFFQYDSRIIV
ncbi:MAG: hypothetical protein RLZZ292_3295 [Bacteroidota bacterium]